MTTAEWPLFFFKKSCRPTWRQMLKNGAAAWGLIDDLIKRICPIK